MQRVRCETDMRDMDKNFELCQAISNYSLLLNLTLGGIIKQLDNIDESIVESTNPTTIIGKHSVGGKTILERFDVLRKEFNSISSLAEQSVEVDNDVTKKNEDSEIKRNIDNYRKFYRSFSNFCLLTYTCLDNVIAHLERTNEGITDVKSRDIYAGGRLIKGRSTKEMFDNIKDELRKQVRLLNEIGEEFYEQELNYLASNIYEKD